MREVLDARRSILVEKLIQKGERRWIFPPNGTFIRGEQQEDDDWYWSDSLGEFLLREQALGELRQRIRRDKKERLDLVLPWLMFILGLIGAATGFIAVWFR